MSYFFLLGLWIINTTKVFYSQETHMTFWCPMRFSLYPLDSQICKFRIGSYAFDENKMKFKTQKLFYDEQGYNTVLDYTIDIYSMEQRDVFYIWDEIGNFSLAGFEMKLNRHSLKYLINYYLPSSLFVIVSWVV